MTWFLGADNYFSHRADDSAGQHFALATLMATDQARPCQIQKTLGTAQGVYNNGKWRRFSILARGIRGGWRWWGVELMDGERLGSREMEFSLQPVVMGLPRDWW